MTYRKKLIEVSLPLEAINVASAREKSIRHGHPSTLHLWWARRPLAACRAVLFSSLVDDPSEYMPNDPSTAAQDAIRIERERLFDIIEDLVIWENSNNEEVLDKAKMEIARSVARNLNVDMPVGKEAIREFLATKAPPVLDPFAGGGSIPLEAQRLGLRAYASDLNPVAVLINKAMIEIPPKFANTPPVHPVDSEQSLASSGNNRKKTKTVPQDELWQKEWRGAQGLAEDVRYYGKWMRDEAFKRIGHLYPPVILTKETLANRPDLKEQGRKAGDQLIVIAWLWLRTVKCPNPACGAQMPLIRSFWLSTKKGKETWAEPIFDRSKSPTTISYSIKMGKGKPFDGTVSRNGAHCVACNTPVPLEYIRIEGKSNRMGAQMWAIVAEGHGSRVYLPPEIDHENIASQANPLVSPETNLPDQALGFRVQLYGMKQHRDLFTNRQLLGLGTFSELISQLPTAIKKENKDFFEYGIAISVYLAFVLDRLSQQSSTLSPWSSNPAHELVVNMFSRQTLQMVWDYGEINPFCEAASWEKCLDFVYKVLLNMSLSPKAQTSVIQSDAMSDNTFASSPFCISTDPPYYDNIGYADLSDYFYVWLRLSLSQLLPDLFGTMLVPKSQELIASPFRFEGSREKAKRFFEEGLTKVFIQFRKSQQSDYPLSVFYAFKQSETDAVNLDNESSETTITASTGWETMLEGLLSSGFFITGTWPVRTEKPGRMISQNTNALASSIVLICRPRHSDAGSITRREFLAILKKEVQPALRELQQGYIAPVDLAQASIGPGMAIFSRYKAVLEADGKPMSVRTALTLINQALDEYLTEQEGEYDGDTRWALTWFEQYGHNEAAYGVAETLSRAKNTSVDGLSEAGIVEARAGKVRLYKRDELDTEWDPTQDKRLTSWESASHLIYALENGGEEAAAELLAKLGPVAEVARDLAYRLYTVCERKGWAQDALGYNMLVVAWPRLKELAARRVEPGQGKLI